MWSNVTLSATQHCREGIQYCTVLYSTVYCVLRHSTQYCHIVLEGMATFTIPSSRHICGWQLATNVASRRREVWISNIKMLSFHIRSGVRKTMPVPTSCLARFIIKLMFLSSIFTNSSFLTQHSLFICWGVT